MLAYINQEEADLLKARGGSGEPHEDTGVPSFDTWGSDPSMSYVPSEQSYTEAIPFQEEPGNVAPLDLTSTQAPAYQTAGEQKYIASQSSPSAVDMSAARDTANPLFPEYQQYLRGQVGAAPESAEGTTPFTAAAGAQKSDPYDEYRKLQAGTPTEKGFFEGMSRDTKARLGIGGAQSLIGAYQISQASEQAKKYREDMAKLAQPYQAEGKKLIAQAQSGELTPAAQQQLQAAQAQAAQGAQSRGGVGAQQAMMAVENMRQQLLQNQYDYGLKVSGIGDQIASGAIKAGMQADQYVNSLAGSYASNIARTLSNAPTYVTSYSQNT
jgi:hypothetical protein